MIHFFAFPFAKPKKVGHCDIVAALMQMMAQFMLVDLEAVATSVDETDTFVGVACDSGSAIVVANFNTGVISE